MNIIYALIAILVSCFFMGLNGQVLQFKENEAVSYDYTMNLEARDLLQKTTKATVTGKIRFDLTLVSNEKDQKELELVIQEIILSKRLSSPEGSVKVESSSKKTKKSTHPKLTQAYSKIIGKPLHFSVQKNEIVEISGFLGELHAKLDELENSDSMYEVIDHPIVQHETFYWLISQFFVLEGVNLESGKKKPLKLSTALNYLGEPSPEGADKEKGHYKVTSMKGQSVKVDLHTAGNYRYPNPDPEDGTEQTDFKYDAKVSWNKHNALEQMRSSQLTFKVKGREDFQPSHIIIKLQEKLTPRAQ